MAKEKQDLLSRIENELKELNTSEDKYKKIHEEKLNALKMSLQQYNEPTSDILFLVNKQLEQYEELKKIKLDPKAKKNKKPEAYNQRDVVSLKPVSKWTQEDEKVLLEHNRIFQTGVLGRPAIDLISDAKLAGEDWITDFCCPTAEAALIMHLAKEMVITYKVGESDLDNKTQEAYQWLLENNTNIINELNDAIEEKFLANAPQAETLENLAKHRLVNTNNNRKKNNLPELPINDDSINAAKRIELDIVRKKITHEVANQYIQKQKQQMQESSLSLELKSLVDTNKDFCFLGAAGSGKSSVTGQFLQDDAKKDYIILATDNYRAFTMPWFKGNKKDAGKNAFAETQDFAYMIKELVIEALQSKQKSESQRPNIIFDGITLGDSEKRLLQTENITSIVAAYAPAGYQGIAERADQRAKDANAAPADKGRFVNTTALFEGHASASARLLTSVPASTIIYDTNVERGAKAIEIGKIDPKTNTIEIRNLKAMSEFFNKVNLNTEAINEVDLVFNSKDSLNLLSTHPENKAKAILELVPATKYKPAFTIKMLDEDGKEYAELTSVNGAVKLNVSNEDVFNKKALPEIDTVEGSVLRAITRQVAQGGVKKSLNLVSTLGDKVSFKHSIKKILAYDTPKVKSTKKIRELAVTVSNLLAESRRTNTMSKKAPKKSLQKFYDKKPNSR